MKRLDEINLSQDSWQPDPHHVALLKAALCGLYLAPHAEGATDALRLLDAELARLDPPWRREFHQRARSAELGWLARDQFMRWCQEVVDAARGM